MLLFLGIVLGCLALALRAARISARDGDRAMEAFARSLLLALIGMLVADFFITQTYSKLLWALLALCPALLGVARREAAARYAELGLGEVAPLVARGDREDDLRARRHGVGVFDVERGLDRPGGGRVRIGRGPAACSLRADDVEWAARDPEVCVEEREIVLDRVAAEGVDDDDRLAAAGRRLRARRHVVRVLDVRGRVADELEVSEVADRRRRRGRRLAGRERRCEARRERPRVERPRRGGRRSPAETDDRRRGEGEEA